MSAASANGGATREPRWARQAQVPEKIDGAGVGGGRCRGRLVGICDRWKCSLSIEFQGLKPCWEFILCSPTKLESGSHGFGTGHYKTVQRRPCPPKALRRRAAAAASRESLRPGIGATARAPPDSGADGGAMPRAVVGPRDNCRLAFEGVTGPKGDASPSPLLRSLASWLPHHWRYLEEGRRGSLESPTDAVHTTYQAG